MYCQLTSVKNQLTNKQVIQSSIDQLKQYNLSIVSQYINFKYMKSQPLILILAIACLSCLVTSDKQVHDITYSDIQIAPQQPHISTQVHLIPQRSVFSRWQYPNTWEGVQFLTQPIEKLSALPKIANIDGQIAFLKDKISQFLKLSTKAELLVQNIKELPDMKNDPLLSVQDEELMILEDQQAKMLAINQQIDAKGVELEKIVQDLMVQQENPLFKEAELNFERKALLQKISLFEELLEQAKSDKKAIENKENDRKVTKYFNELDDIFRKESGLIDAIDTLLKNHNQLTILKARVTSLISQLKAHDLTLAQKQECSKEFQRIKEKQSHDRQVIKLVETLKLKKLEYSEPNKYCQGVVKKLIERIKKLLIGYDYVYECAQELGEVKANRDRIQNELNDAQRKLDELQLSKGIEEFRQTFENNRAVIASKVTELKTLQLDDFYAYPELISAAIADSQNRIAEIQQTLAHLPAKSISGLQQTQQLIRQTVNEIKSLKAQYCKENEQYSRNSEIIQSRLAKLEQQEEYNSWISKVEVQKFEELEEIKRQMKEIEGEIFAYFDQEEGLQE